MVSLIIHSRFNIRERDESRLSLGCNLELNADNVYNTTPAQTFDIHYGGFDKSSITGFSKYRGILIIDNKKLIFEMIAASRKNESDLPIIIRLWDTDEFKEYLFSDNVINFRCECLDMDIPESAITIQLAEFIGAQYEGGIIYPESMEAIGLGEKPFLIPNVSQSELDTTIDKFAFSDYPSETIDNFIRELFNPLTSDEDIVKLTGILMGEIPHIKKNSHFEAPEIKHQMVESEIESSNQYGAIRNLLKIPFDDFEIEIDMISMKMSIKQLSSTDGVYETVNDNTQHLIELQCIRFAMQYFQVIDGRYVFDNKGMRYSVSRISLLREPNDYVTLTIYVNDTAFIRKFDLILLSTISPVITG